MTGEPHFTTWPSWPMRGIPDPNPLVPIAPEIRRSARVAYIATVTCIVMLLVCIALFAVSLGAAKPLTGPWPPPWPGNFVLSGMAITAGLIPLVWITRTTRRKAGPVVVGRVVDPKLRMGDCAFGCLVLLLTLPISLPMAIAISLIRKQWVWAGIQYVENYRLRHRNVRIPKHLWVWIQQGHVVWVVPSSVLRAGTTWSEQYGLDSPFCLVNQNVLYWFDRAEDRAARHPERAKRRESLLRTIRRAQARQREYGRRRP